MKLLLVTSIIGISVSEGFFQLSRIRIHKTIQGVAQKALHVLRSPRISAHWKERVLFMYSIILMRSTLTLLLYLLVIAAIVGLILFGYHLMGGTIEPVINSWTGIVLITVFSTFYLLLRIFYFARN